MTLKEFLENNTVYTEQYVGDGVYETQVVKKVEELGDTFSEKTEIVKTPSDYYKILLDEDGNLWVLKQQDNSWYLY